jgi:hypothetical protein
MQSCDAEVDQVAAAPAGDTERLDWLIVHGARVAPWLDGGWRVCRNWSGRLKWYGRPSPNPREAIDTAMEGEYEH